MNAEEYQKLALRTESEIGILRATPQQAVRLLHAMLGLATEAGEFGDVLKRWLFYAQPLNNAHLAEELGDVAWYVALACDALGMDFGDILESNIRKLQVRYPRCYTNELALESNRNRSAEQESLKGNNA